MRITDPSKTRQTAATGADGAELSPSQLQKLGQEVWLSAQKAPIDPEQVLGVSGDTLAALGRALVRVGVQVAENRAQTGDAGHDGSR
jgi:hypothetical protein